MRFRGASLELLHPSTSSALTHILGIISMRRRSLNRFYCDTANDGIEEENAQYETFLLGKLYIHKLR